MAATAIIALPLGAATAALADSAVVKTNPGGLKAAGPVNAENGFPAWYQDSKDRRVELCLDGGNPMCGFLPGDIPDESQPISFPDNFPEEAFYMLAGSSIDLPGGGRATLTLGLEAAFANSVTNGDQVVFARQRIYVVDGPANATLHFQHPYGSIDIDTDATGKGRLTEDISPAAGNFDTPLKGNIGPFLTWDTGLVQGAGGPKDLYLGDPAVEHAITPGPNGALFSVDWTDGAGAAQHLQNDQFSVQGKVATNVGVKADAAVANGNYLDVFTTSEADPGELYVAAAGDVPSTPMQADQPADGATGPRSFYARIDMTGKTMPASVTIRNIGDNPVSTGQVTVTKPSSITVTDASYNGSVLHVTATSASGKALTLGGYNVAMTGGVADVTTVAPPLKVSVTDGTDTASADVRITDGAATAPGLEPIAVTPDPGPICTINDVVVDCPDGQVPADATPVAQVAAVSTPAVLGDTVVLDASTSTNATSYEWSRVSGPDVQITNGTAAKPSVRLQPYDVTKYTATTAPKAAQTAPAVLQVVAVNGTGATAKRSAAVQVTIPVKADTAAVTSSRFRAGSEIRVDGTSTVPGGSLVLNPSTTVAVYAVYNAGTPTERRQFVGTSPVDTTGAWSVRLRSTTGFTPFTVVDAVSSRGGYQRFTQGTTR